ncbi:unannotated protein [freshwater metagenome]|uniref:Unannotated protein n=1 Tax=freshwater metagenome TaxID=449393 RepID=A0A6J6S612_9ZZZZ
MVVPNLCSTTAGNTPESSGASESPASASDPVDAVVAGLDEESSSEPHAVRLEARTSANAARAGVRIMGILR